MRNKKIIALAGTVALAAGLLAACGSDSGEESGSAATECTNTIKKDDATQVTMWAWYPAFEEVVDLFNEANDDVQICWTNAGAGGAQYTKFSTAIEAKTGAPDVVMLEADFIPSFTVRNALVDITEFGANEVKDNYTPGAWKDVSSGDAVYAIPVDGGPMGMLYRADIFEAAGIEVPSTWEEFAVAAQALKESGAGSVLTNFPTNGRAFLGALYSQAGADMFDFDAASPTEIGINLNDAQAIRVQEYWNDLVQRDLVATDDAFTADYNTKLVDGTYAVYLAAAWGPGYLGGLAEADSDASWRAAPLPQWDTTSPVQVNWGGSTFAVTSQAKDKAAAAKVAMGVMGTEEAWKIGIEEAALFPLWRPILESDYFRDLEYPFFDGQQINKDVFLEAAAGYEGVTFAPFQTYAYDQLTEKTFAMAQRELSADESLNSLQETVETYATSQGYTLK